MHERTVLKVAAVLFVSLAGAGAALAGPPLHDRPSERAAKLDIRAKRARPLVVQAACGESVASTVSAKTLLAELEKAALRHDNVQLAEQELQQARADLTADRERLSAERIDLDLQNAELGGAPVPTAMQPADTGEDEVKKLSATVKVMKPDKAAAVIGVLDRTLAAQVLRTLSRPAAAAIYDRLPPDIAADLMQRIAAYRLTATSVPRETAPVAQAASAPLPVSKATP